MMPVLHIWGDRYGRRKEIGCAKSYNETNLLLETKPDRPDLSHMKLCLVCIGCMRVARRRQ